MNWITRRLGLRRNRNPWGLPVANFGCVEEGHIYRGARPDEQGYAALREFGIETVVNLNADGSRDEGLAARAAGLRWYHLPLSDEDAPIRSHVDSWLTWCREPALRPIFVHCSTGKIRTGGLVAAYRMAVDGWGLDRALDEAERFGFPSREEDQPWVVYLRGFQGQPAENSPTSGS